MESNKRIDRINLVLLFLLFSSYLGHSYNRNIYYAMILITVLFTVAKIIFVKKLKIRESKHFVWYFVFLLFSSVSFLWTIDKGYTFDGVKNVLLILLTLFPIISYAQNKETTTQVINVYILSCIYMCFRLIFFETAQPRVTNDYGQVCGLYFNEIANSLALAIVMSFYIILEKKKKGLIYLVPMVLFYYIIYITGSRKGLLFPILTVSIMIALFIIIRKNKKLFIAGLVSIGMIVIVGGIFILTDKNLNRRITNLAKSFVGIQVEDKSINERNYYRETAMQLFKQSPIVGKGLNSFTAYLEQINYWHVAYSHCNYTEILSGLGIIGFIIYYYEYAYIIYQASKKLKDKQNETILVLAGMVMLCVFEYGVVSYYNFAYQIFIVLLATFINKDEKNVDISTILKRKGRKK